MSCPQKPPWKPDTPARDHAVTPDVRREACDLTHDICVQCGTTMNLIKTKWICPKCRWIVGCCD